MLRISVDFNRMYEDGKVFVAYDNSEDKNELISQFHAAMRIILFEPEDFAVEAVLEEIMTPHGKAWLAEPDRTTKIDLSDDAQ